MFAAGPEISSLHTLCGAFPQVRGPLGQIDA
jgi:hypothetical protein